MIDDNGIMDVLEQVIRNGDLSDLSFDDFIVSIQHSGLDISQLSDHDLQSIFQQMQTGHVTHDSSHLGHGKQVSFGGGDRDYYQKEADHYRYMAESYMKEARHDEEMAESYTKDGKYDKANSFLSSARDWQSKAESFSRSAQEYSQKAAAARS